MAKGPKPRPLATRFWEKVLQGDNCWPWLASHNAAGYGQITISQGVVKLAHRVAWELTTGAIPDGMGVCHHCDNPKCVRPSHLFLGTQEDNMRDAAAKGRVNMASALAKRWER